MPRGYLVRREAGGEIVWEKLRAHGIVTEELTAPLKVEVDSLIISEIKRAPRPFQGHNEIRLRGEYKKETQTFPAGSVFVRTAQPLGTLAAYLLEPERDDGLVAWNFLDSYLAVGKPAPVYKLMNETKIASRRL
jgi:hypothetical protein